MTSVDFIKGHIIHGLLQGLDPLDAGAGFKSVCSSSCMTREVWSFCTV